MGKGSLERHPHEPSKEKPDLGKFYPPVTSKAGAKQELTKCR